MNDTTVQPGPEFNKLYKKILYKDLLKVKEIIKGSPERFNMCHWVLYNYECGTVRCIGGWLEYLVNQRRRSGYADIHCDYDYYTRSKYRPQGEDYLHKLFFPDRVKVWHNIVGARPYNVTTEQACMAIDTFIQDPHSL